MEVENDPNLKETNLGGTPILERPILKFHGRVIARIFWEPTENFRSIKCSNGFKITQRLQLFLDKLQKIHKVSLEDRNHVETSVLKK